MNWSQHFIRSDRVIEADVIKKCMTRRSFLPLAGGYYLSLSGFSCLAAGYLH